MKIIADTNLLVRAVTRDNPRESRIAEVELDRAQVVAVTLPALCELVWVLTRGYRLPREEIAAAIRALVASATVATDRPAVEAGLSLMDAGGDFADGVIAYEGRRLGGETFVSFDKAAVKGLTAQGVSARLAAAVSPTPPPPARAPPRGA